MSMLSVLDLAFLALETAANPKHVAGLGIFDPGKSGPRSSPRALLRQMKEVPAAPPYNQKLDFSLLSMPRWVEDPDIDLDWHIRHVALPEAGDMHDLMLLVSQLHATVLDRSRPLWEFYLIEGLERGKFAIYFKVHHAYMDGVSMSKRVVSTLNTSAKGITVVPFWGMQSNAPEVTPEERNMLRQLVSGLRGAETIAKGIPMMGGLALTQLSKAIGLKKDAIAAPFTAPRTRLNRPLTPARSTATTSFSVARLKKVAKATGTTVNDVLLSLCDSALLAYLENAGEVPGEPLIAQMPISVRREGSGGSGNQITIALVELSFGSGDPVERLKQISERTARVKNHYGSMSEFAATSYTVLVQSLAQLADTVKLNRLLPPLGNVLVSNIVGPKETLYLDGAKLVGLYPISTMPPGVSLNITFFATGGTVYAGIVAGRDAISHGEFVAREMERELKRLIRCAGKSAQQSAHGQEDLTQLQQAAD